MKNTLIRITMAVALVAASGAFSSFTNSPNNKITICHIPPGNPGNCHEITISMNGLDAHLGHGDTFYCSNETQYNEVVKIISDYVSTTGDTSPVEVVAAY
mgnify:FL=1